MAFADPVNMTGIMGMFEYANSVTDNLFGILLLLSLYIIVIGYLNGRGEKILDSMMVSGFITSVLAMILLMGGLIDGRTLFFVFMGLVIPAFINYVSKSG
jgi:hypothetical protein